MMNPEMNTDLGAFQRRNRAKLQPKAPKSERVEYVEAQPIPELKKPRRNYEDRKVIFQEDRAVQTEKEADFKKQREIEERILYGEENPHVRETEQHSLDQSRIAWTLGQEMTHRLEQGDLSENEFGRYRNKLAEVRNYLMSLQSYSQELPEGPRRNALMDSNYRAIVSIENIIHQGDLEMQRQDTARRQEAVQRNWSIDTQPVGRKKETKKPKGFFAKLKSLFG